MSLWTWSSLSCCNTDKLFKNDSVSPFHWISKIHYWAISHKVFLFFLLPVYGCFKFFSPCILHFSAIAGHDIGEFVFGNFLPLLFTYSFLFIVVVRAEAICKWLRWTKLLLKIDQISNGSYTILAYFSLVSNMWVALF